MTDFGRRTGQGDMLKATYDPIIAAMQALAATHATQHRSAGTDTIKLDDLAAPDDNTDLNFNTTKHGLAPKGTNVGNFLKDDGSWASAVDANAIHANVPGEIFSIPESPAPYQGDVLLLETFVGDHPKKRVMLNDIQFRNFVARGDPSSFDFVKTQLSTDGSWHALDLSSIVPAWASMVLLSVTVEDNLVGSFIRFRTLGYSNVATSTRLFTQVANQLISAQLLVFCHKASRIIAYRTTNTDFNSLNITVVGWYLDYTI